jgi:hypothetical protein
MDAIRRKFKFISAYFAAIDWLFAAGARGASRRIRRFCPQ